MHGAFSAIAERLVSDTDRQTFHPDDWSTRRDAARWNISQPVRKKHSSALRKIHSTSIAILYDTRCYFNVRSKADMSQLNLPHGNDN